MKPENKIITGPRSLLPFLFYLLFVPVLGGTALAMFIFQLLNIDYDADSAQLFACAILIIMHTILYLKLWGIL